jgi:hypothetical protein
MTRPPRMPLTMPSRRRAASPAARAAPAAVVRARGVDVALGELQRLGGELPAAARVGEGLLAVVLADRAAAMAPRSRRIRRLRRGGCGRRRRSSLGGPR